MWTWIWALAETDNSWTWMWASVETNDSWTWTRGTWVWTEAAVGSKAWREQTRCLELEPQQSLELRLEQSLELDVAWRRPAPVLDLALRQLTLDMAYQSLGFVWPDVFGEGVAG